MKKKNGNGSDTMEAASAAGDETLSNEDTAELPVLRTNGSVPYAGTAAGSILPKPVADKTSESPAAKVASGWVRDMEAEIEQLQSKWRTLDRELRRADERTAKLRADGEAKDQEISELNRDLEDRQHRIDSLSATVAERDASISEMKSSGAEQTETLAEQLRTLEAVRGEAAVLQDRLQAVSEERDALRLSTEEERAKAVEWRTEKNAIAANNERLLARIQDLETYIEGRKDKWAELNSNIERQKGSIATLQASLEASEAQIADRDEKLAALEQKNLELEQQRSEAEGRHKEREAAFQEVQALLQAQIAESEKLRTTVDDRNEIAAAAELAAEQHREAMAGMESTIATRDAEIKRLESALESAETLGSHMKEQNEKEHETMKELHRELAELKAERDSLARSLTNAESRMDTLDSKLADAERAWSELKDISTSQQSRISALESDLAEKVALIGAFDDNAARLSNLSRSIHFLPGESLEEEFVATVTDSSIQPSLLEDSVLFQSNEPDGDNSTASMAASSAGEASAADEPEESPIRRAEDSLLTELGFDGSRSACRRIMVALEQDFSDGPEYSLSKPIMTIGRAKTSDIRIRDVVVSRTHARLKEEDEGMVIEDAGSKNGVMVNSRVVDRALLTNGDIVSLGNNHEFRYVEMELPAH